MLFRPTTLLDRCAAMHAPGRSWTFVWFLCAAGATPGHALLAASDSAMGETRDTASDGGARLELVPAPPEQAGVAEAVTTPPPTHEPEESTRARDALDAPRPWTLRFEPSVWYFGPGGRLRLPGGDKVRIDDLGFDSPSLVPYGVLHVVCNDRWRIALRGYDYAATRETPMGFSGRLGAVGFTDQSVLRSTLDFATYEAEVGYAVYNYQADDIADSNDASSRLDLLAGVRVVDFSWDVRRTSDGSGAVFPADHESFGDTTLEALGGVRFEMEFEQRFRVHLTLSASIGVLGDVASFTPDIIAGATWKPTRHVGMSIGYRSEFFDLSKGDASSGFSYAGAQQGLMFGMAFEF